MGRRVSVPLLLFPFALRVQGMRSGFEQRSKHIDLIRPLLKVNGSEVAIEQFMYLGKFTLRDEVIGDVLHEMSDRRQLEWHLLCSCTSEYLLIFLCPFAKRHFLSAKPTEIIPQQDASTFRLGFSVPIKVAHRLKCSPCKASAIPIPAAEPTQLDQEFGGLQEPAMLEKEQSKFGNHNALLAWSGDPGQPGGESLD